MVMVKYTIKFEPPVVGEKLIKACEQAAKELGWRFEKEGDDSHLYVEYREDEPLKIETGYKLAFKLPHSDPALLRPTPAAKSECIFPRRFYSGLELESGYVPATHGEERLMMLSKKQLERFARELYTIRRKTEQT